MKVWHFGCNHLRVRMTSQCRDGELRAGKRDAVHEVVDAAAQLIPRLVVAPVQRRLHLVVAACNHDRDRIS